MSQQKKRLLTTRPQSYNRWERHLRLSRRIEAHNIDGRPVAETEIRWIKQTLTKAFGGHTQLTHPSKGASRIGGVTFHDEITILRVLDDGTSHFNMAEFKASLEDRLQQHTVLIVARAVTLIE